MVAGVVMAVVLAGLWYGVFELTGLLWWNAAGGGTVPPPAPVVFEAVDTEWVDLDAYLRTHPRWSG